MNDKIKKGNEGELIAADFLVRKGYTIVAKNYRYRQSEIDLIVKKNNWLVFVEVKMRSSTAFGHPEVFVDWKKQRKVLEGAENYIYKTDWKGNVRYDVVAITVIREETEIFHIEDAFY